MKPILVAAAWPYANGSLHIGHIAALLPADVIARYHRLRGDNVYFVSGSDCHGTPVALRARAEGCTPQEICDRYHEEFRRCFDYLGLRFDFYGKTASPGHIAFARSFHRRLYQSPAVYEKEAPQAYCVPCRKSLSDRYVGGVCPRCGADARGDQCDACGAVLEPFELTAPACALCGSPVEFRPARHLTLSLARLENELRRFVAAHPHWRKNAISFTERYFSEGLTDRALTRDLDWGIPAPWPGHEEKKIYIWAENVLGYLSASLAAERREGDFQALWGEDARHYYVHGKDNIPFHTIILPALLIAQGGGWHLPDEIISSEYLTLEGRKISTSQHYAVWVKDLIGRYAPDSLRYTLLIAGPEKRDADFSFRTLYARHNSELLGAFGNFVNRSLVFIRKYLGGVVPQGVPDESLLESLSRLYQATGRRIEQGKIKEALEEIFSFIRAANKFFDEQRPWSTLQSDPAACARTLYQCVQIIVNLSSLLTPFLPFSAQKIAGWFALSPSWQVQTLAPGTPVPETDVLFTRLDPKAAEEETNRLAAGSAGKAP